MMKFVIWLAIGALILGFTSSEVFAKNKIKFKAPEEGDFAEGLTVEVAALALVEINDRLIEIYKLDQDKSGFRQFDEARRRLSLVEKEEQAYLVEVARNIGRLLDKNYVNLGQAQDIATTTINGRCRFILADIISGDTLKRTRPIAFKEISQ